MIEPARGHLRSILFGISHSPEFTAYHRDSTNRGLEINSCPVVPLVRHRGWSSRCCRRQTKDQFLPGRRPSFNIAAGHRGSYVGGLKINFHQSFSLVRRTRENWGGRWDSNPRSALRPPQYSLYARKLRPSGITTNNRSRSSVNSL